MRRRSDGTKREYWCAQATLLVAGQWKRKTFYGATQKEAQDKRDAYKALPTAARARRDDKTSVSAFLAGWLETVKRTRSPSTYRQYSLTVRDYIEPYIGARRLTDLNAFDIDELFTALHEKGCSTHMASDAYKVLRAALNQAVRYDLIEANPVKKARKPQHTSEAFTPLTMEEAKQFLQAARFDRLFALYVLAITRGLRQAELFGLTWDDIDLRAATLKVRRQVVEHGQAPRLVNHTKTHQVREIDLPPEAVEALREHRKRALSAINASGQMVFTTSHGCLLRKSNFLRRSFFPLLKAAECPRIRFHDLRHTCATLMLKEGASIKTVQATLGHKSAKMTLDVYLHRDREDEVKAAHAVARALFR